MIIEQNSTRENHVCEKNIDTQFESESECGSGVNDRQTSSGEGRVTSDGQCRIIV